MRRWISITAIAGFVLALAFWWLLLDGTAPGNEKGLLGVDEASALVDTSAVEDLPTALRVEIIGTDIAPGFAAQVGDFGIDYEVAYTAFQIEWGDGRSIVIGGAVDKEFAAGMARSPDEATFSESAFDRLLEAYDRADAVYVTHGHSDHVIAIARHEDPQMMAEKLRLSPYQLDALRPFVSGEDLPSEYEAINTIDPDGPTQISPGVVLIPTPGHTPKSQCFYVRLQDGREYLLIGDIAWKASNIESRKTRPRILQYLVFDPNEDRSAVMSQIAQLDNVQTQNPDIVILPSHDLTFIEDKVSRGLLEKEFRSPAD